MPKTWTQNRGGARLAEILRETKEPKAVLERRLDLTPGYVSDAIKGKARPSYSRRTRFCLELGIPLNLWDEKVSP